MVRRTDLKRDTKPTSPELFTNSEEKADLEARNGLLQFDEVVRRVDATISSSEPFVFDPDTILALHQIAIQDIYICAGSFRSAPVYIANTPHLPPPHEEVVGHVEDMCQYVNTNWSRSALHLAAYVMWRLNWTHPFLGGNGRTSRAASYLVLCVKLRYRPHGTLSIPEQIEQNQTPYYAALDAADLAWSHGMVDVSSMENLLSDMLAKQLLSIHSKAAESDRAPSA